MTDMLTLRGRSVVVTGGGRGLGLAMARHLGGQGAHVFLAEVNVERGEAAAHELSADGIKASFVHMDVASPDSVDAAVASIRAVGPIYALVNNAALADGVGGKPFHEIAVEDWDRIMMVNTRGPWLVSRAIAKHMIEAGEGRIVNITSDAALYGSPRLAHYISSKGALISLTRAMARELGPHGITVNAVAPGLTAGEATAGIPEERYGLYRNNRAIVRDQEPEDITGIVSFLIGPESSYITGQLMVVDGGFVFH